MSEQTPTASDAESFTKVSDYLYNKGRQRGFEEGYKRGKAAYSYKFRSIANSGFFVLGFGIGGLAATVTIILIVSPMTKCLGTH